MVAASNRREGLVVDAGDERASVVGVEGNKELAERHCLVTTRSHSFHPNDATTESGFYAVQAHRRRPPCLSRYFLHEALRLRRLGYLDRGCSRRSVPMG